MITDPDLLTRSTQPSSGTEDGEVYFDLATKKIELIKFGNLDETGVTLQAVYSFCKDMWKTESDLIKFPFPILAITEEKFELISDWDFENVVDTRDLVRTGGWALNPAGTVQEEYAGIITLGDIGEGQAYYQQEIDGSATNVVLTGAVNQAVKIYGDAGHGDINYRSYFKIFCREYGKSYAMSQISDIGVTTMTYQVYRFPLAIANDLKIVATDEVVDAETPYTGMQIEWFTGAQERDIGGVSYYFHVIIDGNQGTAEQIYTFVQRQLRKDTDIDVGTGTKVGNVTNALLNFVGDSLYTLLYTTGEGTYPDDHQEIDRTRLYFTDDAGATVQFPYAAILTLNFGDNLKLDSDAIYRVFFTESIDPEGYDYGTENAITVEDVETNPMTGSCYGLSNKQHSYDWSTNNQRGNPTNPDDEEIPITVVAIGLSTAQFVIATGLLKKSLTNVVSLVAPLERNYL